MRPLALALLGALLALAAGCLDSADDTSSNRDAALGQVARAGELDLLVLQIDPNFNPQPFNTFTKANMAVRVRATNARGDAKKTVELMPLAFRVADRQGFVYAPDLNCTRCPDELQIATLARDVAVEGTLYFAIPAGHEVTELRFEPPLTRAKARIALR